MKKLLHERLRELEKKACTVSFVGDGYTFALYPQEAEALADEIERFYIPRPRFRDGEPVQFGDEKIKWNTDGGWKFNAITDVGHLYALDGRNVCAYAEMRDGFVVRQQPKVLDADGVEIEDGETLWMINHPRTRYMVESTELSHGCILVKDETETCELHNPNRFTHRQPVLDADGVEINVGDTVWHTYTGDKATVLDIHYGTKYCIQLDYGEGLTERYVCEVITHKEPDSLEKLRYEMLNAHDKYSIVGDSMVKGWADRLSALIERMG